MIFLKIRMMMKKIIILMLCPLFINAQDSIDLESLDTLTDPPPLENAGSEETQKEEENYFDLVQEMNTQGEQEVSLPASFDVGSAEKELLKMAKQVEGRIPDSEWNEIAAQASTDRYVVQEGEWLWKISQRLFGSGFYYSKIWSLNPQITNPHEIEPGLVLLFTTGTPNEVPKVTLGTFGDSPAVSSEVSGLQRFGEGQGPAWINERKELMERGSHFQNNSGYTYEDLEMAANEILEDEHKKYNPVLPIIFQQKPKEMQQEVSFDKLFNDTIAIKQASFLNTFITTNTVENLGFVDSFEDEKNHVGQHDTIYARFSPSVIVNPGDTFSVYEDQGSVGSDASDREGHRYTITATLEVIKSIDDVWQCKVVEITEPVARNDRITSYVPKISSAAKIFSQRAIEAAIISSYKTSQYVSFGDIVYLDRGRLDGVEVGVVFTVYEFFDRGTGKKITNNPTYKIGELTVISVTDNFSTAIISNNLDYIQLGALAFTKSEEEAAASGKTEKVLKTQSQALGELDIELNVDDLAEDLLEEANKVQISGEELQELERQERANSVLKEHERDLLELEKLEKDISLAESSLNELRVDEDKFLEQQDLDAIERRKPKNPDAFADLDEIEKNVGRKYMDEDLNSRENPYGLTEFDLEEIDELLNTESL